MLKLKLQYFSHLMWKLTHWKRPRCWERLKVGGEADREWDGCMASPTEWTWVWVSSGSWWWTGKPGVLQSMGSQRVRQDWATELISINTISYICIITPYSFSTHSRISFSEITRALGYTVNIYVFSYTSSQLQHGDSSPLSGDLTWVPCIGSSESWTQVQSPIQEDSTHHMWPMCHNSWAHVLQLLKLVCLEPVLRNKRCHRSENSTCCNKEWSLLATTRANLYTALKTQHDHRYIYTHQSASAHSNLPHRIGYTVF